jgi:hypothetical protein
MQEVPPFAVVKSGRTQMAGEIGQAVHDWNARRGSMEQTGAAVTMCNVYCLGWAVLVELYIDPLIMRLPGLFE